MNLNKVEKGLLGYLVQEISPVTEFEVRFGLPIRKFGGDRNRISRKKFIDTLRYFRDNYKIADSNTTLDIIKDHIDKWNWWELSMNPNLTIDFVNEHKDLILQEYEIHYRDLSLRLIFVV